MERGDADYAENRRAYAPWTATPGYGLCGSNRFQNRKGFLPFWHIGFTIPPDESAYDKVTR